jgi:hypothetical protein
MTLRTSIKNIMLKKFFNAILALCSTSTVAAQSEPLKVLFIGNSYTHMNNMPKMFDKIAKDADMNVLVEKCAQSGASFKVHSERPEVYEAIKSRKWDYVILQGYSRELTFDPEYIDTATVPYLNKIVDSVYANSSCTNILFYMTWGYESGYLEREETNTYLKMAMKIEEGYRYLSSTYHVPVVPVGMVWKKVKEADVLDLYAKDRAHPSKEGSYLIASTFFESIFGVEQNEKIGLIKERNAKKIRESVHEVLSDKRDFYGLTENLINLEVEKDKDKFMVNYSIDSLKASSFLWTFEDGKTTNKQSGVYEYALKGEEDVQIRVDIVTECGTTRTYQRTVHLPKMARRARKERRNG